MQTPDENTVWPEKAESRTSDHRGSPAKAGTRRFLGRPDAISDRYQARAEKRLADLRLTLKLEKGATYGDALALAQFRAAIKGKSGAAREVREGIEGKATQRLEHSGPDGGAIELASA